MLSEEKDDYRDDENTGDEDLPDEEDVVGEEDPEEYEAGESEPGDEDIYDEDIYNEEKPEDEDMIVIGDEQDASEEIADEEEYLENAVDELTEEDDQALSGEIAEDISEEETEEETDEGSAEDTAEALSAAEIQPDGMGPVYYTVKVTSNIVGSLNAPKAILNGQYLKAEPEDTWEISVPENATISLQPVLSTKHFKLTGMKQDGKSLKMGSGGKVNLKVTKDTTIECIVKDTTYLEIDGKEVKDKATYVFSADSEPKLRVMNGNENPLDITQVITDPVLDNLYYAGTDYVRVSGSVLATANKNSVKITLKGKTDDNKDFSYKCTLKLYAKVTKVTVKGFNKTQTIGTEKTYPVTVNSGADLSHVNCDYVGASYTKAEYEYDSAKKKGYLKVRAFSSGYLPADGSELTIKLTGNGMTKPATYKVKFKAPKIPAATAKVTAVTNTTATVSLGVPKAARKQKSLCYKITATAVVPNGKTVASGMKESVTEYVKVTESNVNQTVTKTLNLSENEEGEGSKQKYSIGVTLYQYKEGSKESPVASEKSYKTKKFSVTTKVPAYETKLSLKKVNTVVYSAYDYSGQYNAMLATAEFSKNTSYMRLDPDSCYVVNALGERVKEYLYVTDDGAGIYINYVDSYYYPVGPSMLHVKAVSPDGDFYSEEATMAFTVKPKIYDFYITPYGNTIYKKPGKTAELQMQTICESYNYDHKAGWPVEEELKTDKIKWSIDESSSKIKGVKISKKGKVTVPKNLILDADPEQNYFYVYAQAVDYPDNTENCWAQIYVRNVPATIGSAAIQSNAYESLTARDLTTPLKPSDLIGAYVVAYDGDGTRISALEETETPPITVKISDPKNLQLSMYDDGIWEIEAIRKPGKYTLTLIADDGGKSSKKIEFEVKEASTASLQHKLHLLAGDEDATEVAFTERAATLSQSMTLRYPNFHFPTFTLMSNCPGADGFYQDDAALTVKEGGVLGEKVTKDTGEAYWTVRPTALQTVVTYTANGVSEDYTITNSIFAGAATAGTDGGAVVLAPRDEFTFEFKANGDGNTYQFAYDIENLPALPGKNVDVQSGLTTGRTNIYYVAILKDEKDAAGERAGEYSKFMKAIHVKYPADDSRDYLNDKRGISWRSDAPSEDPHEFTLVLDPLNVKPGTYTAYLAVAYQSWRGAIREANYLDESKRAMTTLIPITFTAKGGGSANVKTPSGSLNTSYKINKEAGATVALSLKKPKDVKTTSCERLYNDNKNGLPNAFVTYFELTETGEIKLKEDADPAAIQGKDMSGYVRYTMYSDGGKAVTKTTRITLSWK